MFKLIQIYPTPTYMYIVTNMCVIVDCYNLSYSKCLLALKFRVFPQVFLKFKKIGTISKQYSKTFVAKIALKQR